MSFKEASVKQEVESGFWLNQETEEAGVIWQGGQDELVDCCVFQFVPVCLLLVRLTCHGGEVALTDKSQFDKDRFIYPTGRYWGEFTPENLAFNANLQEFANRVSVICALETGGKISPKEAYDQIRELWRQLKESKKSLFCDRPPPPEPPED